MTTDPAARARELWANIREGIVAALNDQDSYEMACAAADALDTGKRRVIARFVVDDDDDKVDPLSLRVRVDVLVDNKWQGLYQCGWQEAGLTLDEVFEMAHDALAQDEMGIGPGGPADFWGGP